MAQITSPRPLERNACSAASINYAAPSHRLATPANPTYPSNPAGLIDYRRLARRLMGQRSRPVSASAALGAAASTTAVLDASARPADGTHVMQPGSQGASLCKAGGGAGSRPVSVGSVAGSSRWAVAGAVQQQARWAAPAGPLLLAQVEQQQAHQQHHQKEASGPASQAQPAPQQPQLQQQQVLQASRAADGNAGTACAVPASTSGEAAGHDLAPERAAGNISTPPAQAVDAGVGVGGWGGGPAAEQAAAGGTSRLGTSRPQSGFPQREQWCIRQESEGEGFLDGSCQEAAGCKVQLEGCGSPAAGATASAYAAVGQGSRPSTRPSSAPAKMIRLQGASESWCSHHVGLPGLLVSHMNAASSQA